MISLYFTKLSCKILFFNIHWLEWAIKKIILFTDETVITAFCISKMLTLLGKNRMMLGGFKLETIDTECIVLC